MREGASTTGNITMNSTGFLKLAGGTTAQRPASPSPGTIRFNSDTGHNEIFQLSQWNNLPSFANTAISVQNLTLGNTANSTGNMVYWNDPASYNKTLSVMMLAFRFSVATAYASTWLQVDPSITGSAVGYLAPTPITLTFMTGFTDSASNKTVSLYIDDVEYTNKMVFTSSGSLSDESSSAPINIDVAAGQKIRLRVRSSSIFSLGSVVCNLYFMLRK